MDKQGGVIKMTVSPTATWQQVSGVFRDEHGGDEHVGRVLVCRPPGAGWVSVLLLIPLKQRGTTRTKNRMRSACERGGAQRT